ncbi:poly(ADP-ribose) polymerase family member 14-related sequence 1 isoform X2 [Cheilinus undulatus]|uniref:poly(ADP-ribose) polymerase family member 14-related sequence 1 isoform X2 n=1 Tax=Cheilinus undulatus TaxID=241271 RepID=UPI001BD3BD61|nr:poly(ADP-ribose) polymerase family member 14-related sequence 1 isoform X2 [Cheilinus undulatus]
MADAYSHALVVELGENDARRIKNRLVKYFQSKKSSNGGECAVDYKDGSRTAVVRFREKEDQQNVLAKKDHQFRDKDMANALTLTVSLPPEERKQEASPEKKFKKYVDEKSIQPPIEEPKPAARVQTEEKGEDDDSEEEELCSTQAVIEKIPVSVNQEYLEMLVENVFKNTDSPSASQSFTLDVLPAISSAVVTFKSENKKNDFVTGCLHNRNFTKKGIRVRPLELTRQVLVDDVKKISEDYLRLYFDNEGGDVEDFVLNEQEQSALITFSNPKAVQKILMKKHLIQKEEIRVYPFYESLGIALYGKDAPSLKLPAAISEPIEEAVWRYLNDRQTALKTIQNQLTKHFCKVTLGQSALCLNPFPSLLQEQNAKAIVKDWRDDVRSALELALSNIKSTKFQPEPEVWKESEMKIREVLRNEDVAVVPDRARGILSVVGPLADINKLQPNLTEVINKITTRVHREKFSETHDIKVSQLIFNVLCREGLRDKLLQVYPELKMSFSKGSTDLSITGLKDEIFAANRVIYDAMLALKRQHLELDNSILDLLKDEQPEKLTDAFLKPSGINAVFDISANRVHLLAASDRGLTEAGDYLKKLLVTRNIDVEDRKVLYKPEWQDLVSQLENADNKSLRTIRIHAAGQKVVVSGLTDVVKRVSSTVEDFLAKNAQVEETVNVKPNAKVEYMSKLDLSWLKKMEDKVAVHYKKEALSLSGCRVHVTECKKLVEDFISSLVFERLRVPKPGVRTFFREKEDMYVSSLWTDTGCRVQLVDESSDDGQDDNKKFPVPVYQLQTSDGVEIAVCKADMCTYPVDAVVNASNQDLKHSGGLSAALLKAAGPQLQVECDQRISLNGQLRFGDCVITGAGGRLSCKKIIHAVGPVFDPAKAPKTQAQLKRAVKGSLELAERRGCVTVALPAISKNQGFPLDLCATIIVRAVKEHCDEKADDNTLKKIHLVNNDDNAVKAMERAVRQEFGNHGASSSQQTLPTKPLVAAKPSGSDLNCLGKVTTAEGLAISLIKGNIENATTEVVVNTITKDLDLSKGAVSNAIFRVAGPKLQQVVRAKSPSGNVGEVIVTEGCNLKSKQVFHAVAPHWDNGQGQPGESLKGIFRDCLGKAEDSGLASMSLPAIGTGNLGFPRDLAASLMLKEILDFSSKKQPKHLKNIVIILYPGDAKTIQVFTDEFKTQFPNASVGSVPTSSPQKSGPFSKIVSGSGIYETKMGSVAVQVVTGDITKENCDVIVNSSNESFTLKTGVSKAILEAAGPAVEAQCQTLGALTTSDIILTQPGNLKCKNILHLVGRSDPAVIYSVVKNALLMCVKHKFTSVSFPAIGTGQGNAKASQVADAMLDAVIDVLNQNASTTLKTIRIVIFQAPMLKDFHSSMQDREAKAGAAELPKEKEKGWSFGYFGSRIKSLFSGTTEKPKKEDDFVIEPLEMDPACFHICSDSQAKVDSAKMWINDLIIKEESNNKIQDNAILSLSDADHKKIVDIQKNMFVSIRTENKSGHASITIEGLSKNVLKATNVIHEMLRKARDEEDQKRKEELASTVVDWQYQAGLHFQSFDSKNNFKLEHAFEKKLQTVKITLQGQDYTVNMPSGPATDSQGRTLEIKRIDKLKDEDIPEIWDPIPANKSCHAVTIQPGSAEYNEVLTLFQASCKLNVLKIERIQNPGLWKSLLVKKLDMEKRNGHQNNERRLFHGTSDDTVVHINEHGFNRSYAGKNAACYGNGTYFAINASYSASNTYSKPNQNGEKFMYLCRVLTGDYTLGRQNMITPPTKGPVSVQKYDSVVDNTTRPTMFVVFNDIQAYPEYLITFK